MNKKFDESEIQAITDGWLRYTATKDEADWWAANAVLELTEELDPLWEVTLALCAKVDEDDMARIPDIGAGPLESMIVSFGDAAMDLIEPALAHNPTLLKALACVWVWKEPVGPRVDRVLAEHGQRPE